MPPRYLEAVPLRKATAKSIAHELFLLCSRVGIPAEILTDQGTPFMSQLMADLCTFQPNAQADAATCGVWGQAGLGPHAAICTVRDTEVPQASTSFTPFELLFDWQPRGLLDVAREEWEQQPTPHRSVIEHVKEMRERIDSVMPLVRETPHQGSAGAAVTLQPSCPTSRVTTWRPSEGPCPQLCL